MNTIIYTARAKHKIHLCFIIYGLLILTYWLHWFDMLIVPGQYKKLRFYPETGKL